LGQFLRSRARYEEAEAVLLTAYDRMDLSQVLPGYVGCVASELDQVYQGWGRPGRTAAWEAHWSAALDAALTRVEQSLRDVPDDPPALLARGFLLQQQANRLEATALLIAVDQRKRAALIAKARGLYDQAEEPWRRAVERGAARQSRAGQDAVPGPSYFAKDVARCDTLLAQWREPLGPVGDAPAAVPGTVQAEDFDRGGEGIAFHDWTVDQHPNPPPYRSGASVDIDVCQDEGAGYNVGGVRPGEWLGYTVDVAEDALYEIDLRLSSRGAGAKLHVEFDRTDVTGPVIIPKTGDWQRWQTTTSRPVRLRKGRQQMRVVFDWPATGENGYVCNFNWLRILRADVKQ
jgi:hypothetical protein